MCTDNSKIYFSSYIIIQIYLFVHYFVFSIDINNRLCNSKALINNICVIQMYINCYNICRFHWTIFMHNYSSDIFHTARDVDYL